MFLPVLEPACETCCFKTGEDEECEFCMEYSDKRGQWVPKDRSLCNGCPMYGKLVNYPYNNGWKCTRHAEPCFRNADFYNDLDQGGE